MFRTDSSEFPDDSEPSYRNGEASGKVCPHPALNHPVPINLIVQLRHEQHSGVPSDHLIKVRFDPCHHSVRDVRKHSDIGKQFDFLLRHRSGDFTSTAEHPEHTPRVIKSKSRKIQTCGRPHAGIPSILEDGLSTMDEPMIQGGAEGD